MPLPDLSLSLERAPASALAVPAASAVGAIALYSSYSASFVRTPLDDTVPSHAKGAPPSVDPNATDMNKKSGGFADRRGARRAHPRLRRGRRGRACSDT
jgi:hypothetical protein